MTDAEVLVYLAGARIGQATREAQAQGGPAVVVNIPFGGQEMAEAFHALGREQFRQWLYRGVHDAWSAAAHNRPQAGNGQPNG